MAFGILESHSGLSHVPGTSLLDTDETPNAAYLKKGTGKDAHVILVPQPSEDPNDPLNWPLWQRDLILCLYCYCTLLTTGGIGPILSSMAVILVEKFHINFTKVSLLTGYSLCATGAVGIFISAIATKHGKRPVLIFSMTCAFAGTLWGGAAKSYGSLLGARVLQGFSMAMFESVMFSVIGDLYHVHQRGSRMAIYVTSNSGVANLPAMLAGKITVSLGWQWVFWLLAIFLGIAWVGTLLFGWETAFNRSEIYNIDTSSQDNLELIQELKTSEKAVHQEIRPEDPPTTTTTTTDTNSTPRRDSYFKRLLPMQGTYTDESIIKMVARPFFILANPAVVWAVIVLAFPVLWVVGISFVIAQIFSAPPYLLGTAALGYLSAGPVVGGTLGCLVCGWISDPIARAISRRNNGVYEPEFRLLLMLGVAFFSTSGYFLFGNLIVQGKSAAGMAAVWGLIIASVQFTSVAVGSYMVDAYRNISVEVFIASMVLKNFLFFGFSFFLNDWVARWGPPKLFNFIGGIQLVFCLSTVPMWVFGKKLRGWWHTHDVFCKI